MRLSPGTRLGPYEIGAPIGAGGMGAVYRARDVRLQRDVAVKVLPEALTRDEEARSRFEREAQAIAALSHPNLLDVHDVGSSEATSYIVFELLEGETLRARLARGPLAWRRATKLAIQLCRGLAAAHEKGIVHRDLKPENLFLTSEGRAKILDFGLASQLRAQPDAADDSPTQGRATEPGQLLGTVGYMSPEQVRGQPADHRSDIFSLGVVIYEMLSGRAPFHRDTAAETLTAILREDAPELRAPGEDLPGALAQIVQRCLEKDPAARPASANDLAFDLQLAAGLASGPAAESAGDGGRRRQRRFALAVVASFAAGGLGGPALVWLKSPLPDPPRVTDLSINLPAALTLGVGGAGIDAVRALALAPDGTRLVYRARSQGAGGGLYVRSLGDREAKPIDGSETLVQPFFSADGRTLGAFDTSDSQFKSLQVAGGGAARAIARAEDPRGATWGEDGSIVLAPTNNGGLVRVAAAGGAPQPITTLEPKSEASHRQPQLLAGGKLLLYTAGLHGRPWDEARIVVHELRSGRRVVAVDGGTGGRYVRTGHIVYGRQSNLMAVPFDLAQLRATGPSVTMIEGVSVHAGQGIVQFDVADDGTLVYVSGGAPFSQRSLVWVDRAGNTTPATTTGANYTRLSVAGDGRRAAVELYAADNDVWLLDLANGALTRRTFLHENGYPLLSADGRRLVFRSDRDGPMNLYLLAAEGSEAPQRIAAAEQWQYPASLARDGSSLLFDQTSPRGDRDVWTLRLGASAKPTPLAATRYNESRGAFSPDVRLFAYQSDESGRSEIYVQPFPPTGAKHRVSLEGGSEPAWSPDGRELYFLHGAKLMSARIETRPSFSSTRPHPLFEAPWARGYTAAADGRFLMIRASAEETSTREIHVVLNFDQELRRRAPPARN